MNSIKTISIPAGIYSIGNDNSATSRPAHELEIDAFSIAEGCVTNHQFAYFINAECYTDESLWTTIGWRWRESKHVLAPAFWLDRQFNHPDQPVVGVAWYTAMAYAKWLSRETGQVWRLPTEVEWEIAGQSQPKPHQQFINSAERGLGFPLKAVGEGYRAENGVWNMRGNVWEWCLSRWGRNWQSLDYGYPYVADDGREDTDGSHARVMRGGSWFDTLGESHCHHRGRYLPGSRGSNIGFRLVQNN